MSLPRLLLSLLVASSLQLFSSEALAQSAQSAPAPAPASAPALAPAKVYYIRQITPENLVRLYRLTGRKAHGRVAVKISTGEPGGHNFLAPSLIAPLVKLVGGTIVECNTAYKGKRYTTADHLQAAADHGFTAIAPVDIMDAESQVELPVSGGRRLTSDLVGGTFPSYDFTIVLSHFKGHAMGGFGGAIKNMSIGIASSQGKARIHRGGRDGIDTFSGEQLAFLEAMAEAAKAVADHQGENIVYLSVANNLSVDCDCDSSPADPQMGDLGLLASTDPVALDRACTDLVRRSPDHGKLHLIERIDSRHGMHTLEYAEQIGLGTQRYELIEVE